MDYWNRFRRYNREDKERNQKRMKKSNESDFFSINLHDNIQYIKKLLGNSSDIIIREFVLGSSTQAAVLYIEELTNQESVNEFILNSLMSKADKEIFDRFSLSQEKFEFLYEHSVTIGEVEVLKDKNSVILSLLSGESLLIIDGCCNALACNTPGGDSRSIEEPSSQVVIRGPKDGFTESIGTNVSLVRRRIKSPNLWLERMKVGHVTQTSVAIMYIKGIANDEIVEEVKSRLNDIQLTLFWNLKT